MITIVQQYRNNNRFTRPKIRQEDKEEFIKKANEFNERRHQTQRALMLEHESAMYKKMQANVVARTFLDGRLYRELYPKTNQEKMPVIPGFAKHFPQAMYLEQIFRLFPKELYQRNFFGLHIAKFIEKLRNPKKIEEFNRFKQKEKIEMPKGSLRQQEILKKFTLSDKDKEKMRITDIEEQKFEEELRKKMQSRIAEGQAEEVDMEKSMLAEFEQPDEDEDDSEEGEGEEGEGPQPEEEGLEEGEDSDFTEEDREMAAYEEGEDEEYEADVHDQTHGEYNIEDEKWDEHKTIEDIIKMDNKTLAKHFGDLLEPRKEVYKDEDEEEVEPESDPSLDMKDQESEKELKTEDVEKYLIKSDESSKEQKDKIYSQIFNKKDLKKIMKSDSEVGIQLDSDADSDPDLADTDKSFFSTDDEKNLDKIAKRVHEENKKEAKEPSIEDLDPGRLKEYLDEKEESDFYSEFGFELREEGDDRKEPSDYITDENTEEFLSKGYKFKEKLTNKEKIEESTILESDPEPYSGDEYEALKKLKIWKDKKKFKSQTNAKPSDVTVKDDSKSK